MIGPSQHNIAKCLAATLQQVLERCNSLCTKNSFEFSNFMQIYLCPMKQKLNLIMTLTNRTLIKLSWMTRSGLLLLVYGRMPIHLTLLLITFRILIKLILLLCSESQYKYVFLGWVTSAIDSLRRFLRQFDNAISPLTHMGFFLLNPFWHLCAKTFFLYTIIVPLFIYSNVVAVRTTLEEQLKG